MRLQLGCRPGWISKGDATCCARRLSEQSRCGVPRYFFDLIDGADAYPDDEGTVLPGLKSARDEACEALLGLARDKIPSDGMRSRVLRMVVRSEDGGQLLAVTLNYAEEPADWSA
jgi:hypothetical protein